MIIGGLQKFSLLDYPEHLSAIIFTQGCNFRCQFCYNPMLVCPSGSGQLNNTFSPLGEEIEKGHPLIRESDLFDFLKSRIGKLDAVVITGGEPTLHLDLPEFISKIRDLKFKVKLDTNGTNPKLLKLILENDLLNYIAMDIKSPIDKYDLITGVQPDLEKIEESISLIRKSGLSYEFRSTIVPELIDLEDIKKMGTLIKGAKKWYLQKFNSNTELVNKTFEKTRSYESDDMEKMKEVAKDFVEECGVR